MEKMLMIPDNIPVPNFNPETQYLGQPEIDENSQEWFFPVIDYSEDQKRKIFEINISWKQKQILDNQSQNTSMETFQSITDQSEAYEVKEVFPLWSHESNYLDKPLGYKVTRILPNGEGGFEVALFFLIQPHTPNETFTPETTPALWSRVIIGDGGIEVWTQPIGGDGKYPYIDPETGQPYKVTHNGNTWQNNHQGGLNVWAPGVFGWTQI
jgi:hypothetical protein